MPRISSPSKVDSWTAEGYSYTSSLTAYRHYTTQGYQVAYLVSTIPQPGLIAPYPAPRSLQSLGHFDWPHWIDHSSGVPVRHTRQANPQPERSFHPDTLPRRLVHRP